MSRDHKTPLRLTKEQNALLESAATACNQSKQSFIENAVFSHVDDVLERKQRLTRVKTDSPTVSAAPKATAETTSSMSGLGAALSSIVQQKPATHRDDEYELRPSTAAQGVTVNVGNGAPSGASGSSSVGNDIIEYMADYVMLGHSYEKSYRLRIAIEVVTVRATNDEERKTLAARLDEAVSVRIRKSQEEGIGGSILSAAKSALGKFNKIAHLITE